LFSLTFCAKNDIISKYVKFLGVDRMLAIIDYGAGNLRSVQKACEYVGATAEITSDKNKILAADHVILPGVGAFGDCMSSIKERDLDACIKEVIANKVPFLGICLGLQLLFEKSQESPNSEGLGIFKGEIVKIPDNPELKIPHMGWNSVTFPKTSPLFEEIDEGSFVYFVHSFYMEPEDSSIISATCNYSKELPVALSADNVHATQFHPEKSGKVGLRILKNFVDLGGVK